MQADINTLTSTRVPRGLTELITLGRTLKRRAGDILAYFDHPHTSNGPTEAINGRLEHLRGSALGLAKPHQLHHPSTPRNRRIQTPTTPPIMKSPFGVHNFYLGYTKRGAYQLGLAIAGIVLSIVVIGVFLLSAAAIWGFVEFVMILIATPDQMYSHDANGVPLAS